MRVSWRALAALWMLASCAPAAPPDAAPPPTAAPAASASAVVVPSAEWEIVFVSPDRRRASAINTRTLERIGSRRRVWVLHNLLDRPSPLSLVTYNEFDCARRTSQYLQGTTYAELGGMGAPIRTNNQPQPPEHVAPGTTGETVLKAACRR